jgi:hypothetical protein
VTSFKVSGNSFSGAVPVGNMQLIREIHLDGNKFTGPLPELPYKLMTKATCVLLDPSGGNKFTCPWPAFATDCSKSDGSVVTDDDCTGTAPPSPPTAPPTPAPGYRCDSTTGVCQVDATGTQQQATCEAMCKIPTPPPTPPTPPPTFPPTPPPSPAPPPGPASCTDCFCGSTRQDAAQCKHACPDGEDATCTGNCDMSACYCWPKVTCTGPTPPTAPPTPPPAPSPPTPPTPAGYVCVPTKGQCFESPDGSKSQAECEAECLTYSCVADKGQCFPDAKSNSSQIECVRDCSCVPPHNCGQLNGTVVCGERVAGCNVCDACCKPFPLDQDSCNACVVTPAKGQAPGCGWPTPSPAPLVTAE